MSPPLTGTSARLLALAETTWTRWRSVGVTGSFLARDLDSGEQFGVDVDRLVPLASVAKVPLALVVADRVARGELDGGQQITLTPEERSDGPTGLAAFTHTVTCSVSDLVLMMLSVSDNAAADALFALVSPDSVARRLDDWEVRGIHVRHAMQVMYDYATKAAGDFGLATQLAVEGMRPDGRHVIGSLDIDRATVGSAAGCVDLLQRIWQDTVATPQATAFVRDRMARQLHRNRLGADLVADDIHLAAKSGTFLNLRHEIGVVTQGRTRVAMAALTQSHRTARQQPDVDLAIAAAARDALEAFPG